MLLQQYRSLWPMARKGTEQIGAGISIWAHHSTCGGLSSRKLADSRQVGYKNVAEASSGPVISLVRRLVTSWYRSSLCTCQRSTLSGLFLRRIEVRPLTKARGNGFVHSASPIAGVWSRLWFQRGLWKAWFCDWFVRFISKDP